MSIPPESRTTRTPTERIPKKEKLFIRSNRFPMVANLGFASVNPIPKATINKAKKNSFRRSSFLMSTRNELVASVFGFCGLGCFKSRLHAEFILLGRVEIGDDPAVAHQ